MSPLSTSTLDPFADGSIHTMAAIKKPEGIPRKNVSVGVSVARWRDISMISKGCQRGKDAPVDGHSGG